MAPKQRITKEMVMEAAFELLREGGEQKVLVKNIAEKLACSVQPIYSYCENMDSLRGELSLMAGRALQEFVAGRIDREDPFASTGKAYVDFAKEEPNLFKSYYLRKRPEIHSFSEMYDREAAPGMSEYLVKSLGISLEAARELHIHMIIYSAGISFLLISTGGNLPQQALYDKLDHAYLAFAAKPE